jgi:quercetin dioxygenase-like cupin family protein
MLKAVVLISGVLGLAFPAAAQVNHADLKWGPAPAVLPAGAQVAVLAGDPGTTGQFVIRLKMPAGYKVPPHTHPTDEYVTVMSGDLAFGMGDKLDAAKATRLTAGGFALARTGMSHFAVSTGGAELEIAAQGPFVITYVNPADDPSRH